MRVCVCEVASYCMTSTPPPPPPLDRSSGHDVPKIRALLCALLTQMNTPLQHPTQPPRIYEYHIDKTAPHILVDIVWILAHCVSVRNSVIQRALARSTKFYHSHGRKPQRRTRIKRVILIIHITRLIRPAGWLVLTTVRSPCPLVPGVHDNPAEHYTR